MRSPREASTLQIEVTNACFNGCSGCTRFCGHHKKPFFMDFETFTRAVDSLDGYWGRVGIMGGEPTLHPEFERLIRYYAERVETNVTPEIYRYPFPNFAVGRQDDANCGRCDQARSRRGLWTSIGHKYYENFELIQDVFPFQNLNDHVNPGLHQALLITRKELGIPDDRWYALRDNCWVQNLWSGCVTPKGAFFCEVAAALDTLLGGPGGWPIEPGWWKRTPADFGAQLNYCEFCSAALRVPHLQGNAEIDLVSPRMYGELERIQSPKLRSGMVRLFDTANYSETDYRDPTQEGDCYLPEDSSGLRISDTNSSLWPRRVLLSGDPDDDAAAELHGTLPLEDVEHLRFDDWVIVVRPGARLLPSFAQRLKRMVFNPGCLYVWAPGSTSPPAKAAEADVLMFNRRAHALRGADRIALDTTLAGRWYPAKVVALRPQDYLGEAPVDNDADVRARALALWAQLAREGRRVAVYGAGTFTAWLEEQTAGLPAPIVTAVLDRRGSAAGQAFGQVPEHPEDFDPAAADVILVSAGRAAVAREMGALCEALYGMAIPILAPGVPADATRGIDGVSFVAAAGSAARRDEATAAAALAARLEERGDYAGAERFWARALTGGPEAHSAYLQSILKRPEATPETLLREQVEWARRHADFPPNAWSLPDRPGSGDRLRIGFTCSFFAAATCQNQLLPWIPPLRDLGHDIFFYASEGPEVGEALRRLTPHVVNRALSDEEFARVVRADKLDILVEASGFSPGHRFLALARRCAPIQVSYMNHAGTSGVNNVDVILGDDDCFAPGEDQWYTERIVRMRRCFFCFNFQAEDFPRSSEPPLESAGHPTVGFFGSGTKLNDRFVEMIAGVLRAVPASRLLMANAGLSSRRARNRLAAKLAALGIATERLDLLPGQSRREVAELHTRVDITLDSYPYCGGNTLSESLWYGVPAVTLAGERFSARYGASILKACGLGSLVAETTERYTELCAGLLESPARLRELRHSLRDTMLAPGGYSDVNAFAAEFDRVCRAMVAERRRG